ncbi:LTA synthase family protein [Sporosalibacterium faouarense]|uniref:LTA synthase family protein n=1 Tax=Sporosalibacterium faouarense TaxID=516123 RepID=UPI00141CEA8D|nr:LTA synthase family protein [Sporosalibacterium faouarense]MTI46222.1 LTA synthase family protein [Bacillota bacterium]
MTKKESLKNNKNDKVKELYKLIGIMILISLVKVLILYGFTNEKHIVIAFLRTIPAILLFYSILAFIPVKRLRISSFIIHALVGGILFVDLVYYQYYGFLPSVTMFLFVGNVPTVWKSILFILRPIYFVMLVDLIPLGILLRKKEIDYSIFKFRNRTFMKVAVSLLAVFMLFPGVYINGNTTYAYNNYGVFTYHIYDAYTKLSNRNEELIDQEELDKKVKEIVDEQNEGYNKTENYKGIAKGKNIIVVQFESLQNFLIGSVYNGQELTPNLNKFMKSDAFYFDNFYQQVGPGNTSDAEFILNNSLYPTDSVSTFKKYNQNYFYSLPKILKENGYSTYSFHGNNAEFWGRSDMYPRIGIDNFVSLEDFQYDEDDLIGLGINDVDFFDQAVDHLKDAKKPFYSVLITLTSHHPYDMPEELIDIKLKKEHEDTLFGNYIQSINYSDKAFGQFIEKLKDEGLYEDSMIVLYGDHSGLYPARAKNKDIMSDYLGTEYTFDEYMNIPLIINIPGKGISETKEIVGGEMDLFPTILNLVGIDDLKGKRYGRDLLNSEKGFVANQYYIPKGSFIDDDIVFEMSKDGIYENSRAWDRKTKEPIDIEKCREGYLRAMREIKESNFLSDYDLIDDIINEQENSQNN